MKKIIIIAIVLLGNLTIGQAATLDIMSRNAILYNLDEETVLYDKASEEEIPIASMTKIMTAIIAIEHIDNLDEQVKLVNSDFAGLAIANASVAGFRIGQVVTYRDLLYGLLLPSGADAAQALTRLIGNSRDNFVQMMNDKALALGLQHTHFVNETGLDAIGHFSTVKEVATIFKYAISNEELKEIFLKDSYTTSDNTLTFKSTILSYKQKYNLSLDYLLGGKTGTTDNAGLCLASWANYNGVNYLLVSAGAFDKDYKARHLADAKIVYEYFMNNYANHVVIKENEEILKLPTLNAKEKDVVFKAMNSYSKYLSNDYNEEDIKKEYEGVEVVPYNASVGTKLGVLSVYVKDDLVAQIDIILNTSLHFDLFLWMKNNLGWVIIEGVMIIIIILGIIYLIKKGYQKAKISNNN